MSSDIEQLALWLTTARRGVAFTGAGISTESGIPDFRSPGGVWARTQPVYFDDFVRSAEARLEYWRQKSESHHDMAAADPNVTHKALARWESLGWLRGVVTQNIDGLHQLAGSASVLELHGTARQIMCLDCRARFDAVGMVADFEVSQVVPDCPECGGLLKHATISFGQSLETDVLRAAMQWSREADFYLALGSSLVVYPAAGLPASAAESGAKLIIINREATPLDSQADLVIRAPLGEAMAAIEAFIEGLFPSESSGSETAREAGE